MGTFAAGMCTRHAIGFATPEFVFAPLGPIVAMALGDTSSTRNIVSSTIAFVLGFIAFLWLAP